MAIVVAGIIYNRFRQSGKTGNDENDAMTTEDVSRLLHLPSKLSNKILSHLNDLDIIRETIDSKHPDQHVWTPGRDVSSFSIADLLEEEMDVHGASDFKYDYDGIFNKEWDILCQMRKAHYDAGKNALLADIKLHSELIKK